MARVLGIGGVFFKSNNPGALTGWYRAVLGLDIEDWGGAFIPPDGMAAHPGAGTVFSPFPADTTYFAPSTRALMINLAVDDLDGILARCAEHGVQPTVLSDEPNGRFAHIVDPDGTQIELWQPRPMPAWSAGGRRARRVPSRPVGRVDGAPGRPRARKARVPLTAARRRRCHG